MDKFSFIGLWDTYNGLLTATQREITDMYFNMDLTVSEIAEEKGVSRQAVSECLKGCKAQLEEYERKLHIFKRLITSSLETSFKLTEAVKWVENFKNAHAELSEEADGLKEILEKDFTEEAEACLNNPDTAAVLEKDYTLEVYGRRKTGEE